MVLLRNAGARTTAVSFAIGTTVVPFDTVTNTNDRMQFNASDNSVSMPSPGWFDTDIEVSLASVAANTITVSLLSNGTAIPGNTAVATLAAGDAQTVSLRVPVQVAQSGSTVAKLQWAITVTAAATMSNVNAVIRGIA